MRGSVTTEQILDALSAVMVQAEDVGFDWTCVESRHEDMSGWIELVRPRMGSAQKGGVCKRRKRRKRRRPDVGGDDPSTSGTRWQPRRRDIGGGDPSTSGSVVVHRRADVGGGESSAMAEERRRDRRGG